MSTLGPERWSTAGSQRSLRRTASLGASQGLVFSWIALADVRLIGRVAGSRLRRIGLSRVRIDIWECAVHTRFKRWPFLDVPPFRKKTQEIWYKLDTYSDSCTSVAVCRSAFDAKTQGRVVLACASPRVTRGVVKGSAFWTRAENRIFVEPVIFA